MRTMNVNVEEKANAKEEGNVEVDANAKHVPEARRQ